MLQVLLVNLMVPGQYSVLNVEGGPPQMPMSISVKLHLGEEWYRNLPARQWAEDLKVLLPTTCLLNNRYANIPGGPKIS